MKSPVTANPKIMHGSPCFTGTRVMVQSLFDHLEAGYSIDEFLDQFPTVSRAQITELLAQLRQRADQDFRAAG